MIHPITFSIPEEKICNTPHVKTKIVSNLIPGDISTYIYNTEEEYYKEYQQSFFALTMKKAGWDCMRHYEIIANGCIPYFIDIENCPKNTMYLLPKELIIEGNSLYKKFYKNPSESMNEYYELQQKMMDYTKEHLTTKKMAQYVLSQIGKKTAKILYLSGDPSPDYLRCLTLHGLKELIGSDCHDYPKIEHIYKSNINVNKLYGKGMSYSNLLDQSLHNDVLNATILEDIKNKYYDIVIYGSYHRGMPLYDFVSSIYDPSEIILFCGEDLHKCNYDYFVKKGHHVFVREL